mgnify:CR=1 FL=1|jgi:hypothetical protein
MNRRRRSIWTEPLEPFLLRLPFAGVVISVVALLGAVGLNFLFVYSVITGNMIGRYAWTPVEGRESAPILYSIYLFGIGAGAVLIDLWAFDRFIRSPRKKK